VWIDQSPGVEQSLQSCTKRGRSTLSFLTFFCRCTKWSDWVSRAVSEKNTWRASGYDTASSTQTAEIVRRTGLKKKVPKKWNTKSTCHGLCKLWTQDRQGTYTPQKLYRTPSCWSSPLAMSSALMPRLRRHACPFGEKPIPAPEVVENCFAFS
jgi:hypothetical protein